MKTVKYSRNIRPVCVKTTHQSYLVTPASHELQSLHELKELAYCGKNPSFS